MFGGTKDWVKAVALVAVMSLVSGCLFTTGPDKAHDPAFFAADNGKAVVVVGVENINILDFSLGWRSSSSFVTNDPNESMAENIAKFEFDRFRRGSSVFN